MPHHKGPLPLTVLFSEDGCQQNYGGCHVGWLESEKVQVEENKLGEVQRHVASECGDLSAGTQLGQT